MQRFTQTGRGIVAYRYERAFYVRAGPMSRRDELLFAGVDVNGTVRFVRIINDTIGGKAADSSQLVATTSQYERPNPGDVFEAPFDARYVRLYRFQVAGPRTISFSPITPRYGVGQGTFTYDSHDNVVRYQYVPSTLPQHATSATIVDVRRQVLPGYWAVTQEVQQYSGRYGMFGGAATVQITLSGFVRFSTLAQAERAVAREAL